MEVGSSSAIHNGGIGMPNPGITGGISNINYVGSLPNVQYNYGSIGKFSDIDGSTAKSIEQDKQDCIKWINSHISKTEHPLILDLEEQLSDGLTLIKLLEELANERLPKYYTLPKLKMQKIENTKECLDFMSNRGINVTGIRPEELIEGNVKAILSLCHLLKLRVDTNITAGFPALYNPSSTSVQYSNTYIGGSQPNLLGSQAELTKLEGNDLTVLSWASGISGIPIQNYNQFYDGLLICNIIGKICGNSLPREKLEILTPIERYNLAFDTAERELSIPKQISPWDATSGHDNYGIMLYLRQLHQVYDHRVRQQEIIQQIEEEARQQRQLDERISKLKDEESQLSKHKEEIIQGEQKINELAENIKQREQNLKKHQTEEDERIKKQMAEYTTDIMNRQVEQQLYNESKRVHDDLERQLEQRGTATNQNWLTNKQQFNGVEGDRVFYVDDQDQYTIHMMKQKRRRQLGELELQKKQLDREWKIVEQKQQEMQRQWYQMQEQHNHITQQLTERQLDLQRLQEELMEKDHELKRRTEEHTVIIQQQQIQIHQREEHIERESNLIQQKTTQLQLLQKELDMQQKYLAQEKSYVENHVQKEQLDAREKLEKEKIEIKKQRDELTKKQRETDEKLQELVQKRYELQLNEQEEVLKLRKRIEEIEKIVQEQYNQLITEQKKRNDQCEEVLGLRQELRLKDQQLERERQLREKEWQLKEDELNSLEKKLQQDFDKRLDNVRSKEIQMEQQRRELDIQLRTIEERAKADEIIEQEKRRQEHEKRIEELRLKEKLLEEEQQERARHMRLQEEKRKEGEILEKERKRRQEHEKRLQEKLELEERIKKIERLQQEVREQRHKHNDQLEKPLLAEKNHSVDTGSGNRPFNNSLKPAISESVLTLSSKLPNEYSSKSPLNWTANDSLSNVKASSPLKSTDVSGTASKNSSRLPMTKLGGSTSNLSNLGNRNSNFKKSIPTDRYVEPSRSYESATRPAGVIRAPYVTAAKQSPTKSPRASPIPPVNSPILAPSKTPEPSNTNKILSKGDFDSNRLSPTKSSNSAYTSPLIQNKIEAFAKSNEMKVKYPNLPATPLQKSADNRTYKSPNSSYLSKHKSPSAVSLKSSPSSGSKRAEATQLVRRGARTPGGAYAFDF